MNRDRFKGASWFNHLDSKIMVIGAGGIGSHLIFQLSRLGPDLIVYDGDEVSSVNTAGQLYGDSQIGQSKVSAIESLTKLLSDKELESYEEMYTEDSPTHSIIFTGLDNMEARKIVYRNWIEEYRGTEAILIDGRLNAESFQIYTLLANKPEFLAKYEKEALFNDEEAVGQDCSYKQTTYAAALIAGEMISNYVNWVGLTKRGFPFRVPFFYERNLLIKNDRHEFYS